MELYQPGSEGPQWWVRYPDEQRGLPARSILDRCNASKTCPKIVEHFGAAEIWGLKLGPEWVGTDPKEDIPLPDNVRRYYVASTSHGGGVGGFDTSLPGVGLPTKPVECPGNNSGYGVLPANPMPHGEIVNAITVQFRDWVMKNTPPPGSRYPTLRERQLVAANKTAMGFPTIPGLRATAPEPGFMNPVLDYDWGPNFDANDGSGVPGSAAPRIRQVIQTLVPKVDADGNEVGGVPVVLREAPLGTYLGWNITAGGERPFHQDKLCTYAGGMVPFAKSKAERMAKNDPRLSLEERYVNHAGYVTAVRKAAANAVAQKFLLQKDADALIAAAETSAVLKYVINKCDLGSAMSQESIAFLADRAPLMRVSAITGEGIEELKQFIYHQLVSESQVANESAIITNERHYQALEQALGALRQAKHDLISGFTEEVALANLHQALKTLGVITGETLIADIINQIFSTFCIGK